mgnify:CR=1 FL=1
MKDKIYHQPNLAKSWFLALLCFLALCMQSCRDSDTVISSEPEDTGSKAEKGDIMGFYLLNQGNMGSNKATLDFLDLSGDNGENIIYHRNIYSERNPNEIKELWAMTSRYMAPNCGWSSTAPTRWRWQMPILAKK